jgi:hypothetical protein
MTYAWTVKVQRSSPPHYDNLDSYTFTVAAETSESATKKAIREAKAQSGFKRVWRCVALERGGWLVS